MPPTAERLKSELEARFPGLSLGVEGAALIVPPQRLADICRWLRDTEPFSFDYLANLTAVDYPKDPDAGGTGRIDVVYHLYSMAKKHGPVTLKVHLPRATPPPVVGPEAGSQSDPGRQGRPDTGGEATPVVASVTPIWRGAEFQEREVYDLFGVRFEGHPDLRRILMWDGFEGHPMRKDYVVEDQDTLEERA